MSMFVSKCRNLAGTLDWSDPVSHDCGSFVECGPTIMPHSPASQHTSFTCWDDPRTHTHTHPAHETRAGFWWTPQQTRHDMTSHVLRGTQMLLQPPKSTKTGRRRRRTQEGPQNTCKAATSRAATQPTTTHTPTKNATASKARPTDCRGTAAKQRPTHGHSTFRLRFPLQTKTSNQQLQEEQLVQTNMAGIIRSWQMQASWSGSRPISRP